MIYHDPSEARKGSRVSTDLIGISRPLPGLETATGADFLVTPVSGKPDEGAITNKAAPEVVQYLIQNKATSEISDALDIDFPTILNIQKMLEMCSKGILIQRKDGMDLLSSIKGGHLSRFILYKMSLWDSTPWLIFVGTMFRNVKGNVTLNERGTNWPYKTVQGVLNSWQLRGGKYTNVLNSRELSEWMTNLSDKMEKFDKLRHVPPKFPRQLLINNRDASEAWITLATLPNIGEVLAQRLIDWAGSPSRAIEWLTDPHGDQYDNKPKGIGPQTREGVRKWLGISDGNMLAEIGAEIDE